MRTDTAIKHLEGLVGKLQRRANKLREASPRKGHEQWADAEALRMCHRHVEFLEGAGAEFTAVRDRMQDAFRRRL